jgi:folate-dependent phosphoribosylglycinamide formyltransferase PurN
MLLCAGFMRVLPDNICLYWPGLNVHPADLTIRLPDGSARYGGLQAVPKVIADSQLFVRASVHLIRNPVDDGMVISTSRPLWINAAMKENPRVLHAKLRQEREHRLYPATLNFLHDNDANVSDFPLRDLA